MFAPILVLTITIANVVSGCNTEAQRPDYVKGEVLVKFRAGVSEERMAEIHRTLGNQLAQSWPEIRWYRVLLKAGLTVPEGIQQYRSLPEVEDAEPNFRKHLGPPAQGPPTRQPQ